MFRPNRWQIFAVLSGMYLLAYFYRVSAAVIAGDLSRDLDLSASQLGNASAALFYAFAFAQLPLGPLLDRLGPRRVVSLLGLVTAGGALLFARAESFPEAMAGRLLIGLGTSCVLMGSLKVYTRWFSAAQFGTLSGIQVGLGNLGNLLATAPLAWVAATFGWRDAFTGMAMLTLLGALAVWLLVRDAPQAQRVEPPAGWLTGWGQVFARPQFWALALLAFFWYGTYMAVQGLWGGPYLMQVIGLDSVEAGRLLFLSALGFIIGCPLAGRLSDRILCSRKKVLWPGQLGLLLLSALFLGPLADLPAVLRPLIFFLFGLCVSTGPLLFAQVKELFPGGIAATAMTAVNFFVVLGAALMQQVMGTILQGGGQSAAEFGRAFLVPVAGLAIGWTVYLFCPDSRMKKR